MVFICIIDAGYTIFVVEGELPPCEADQLLSLVPIQTDTHTSKKKPSESGGHYSKSIASSSREKHRSDDEDTFALELATALSASMTADTNIKHHDEHFDITIATALSMQGELGYIHGAAA